MAVAVFLCGQPGGLRNNAHALWYNMAMKFEDNLKKLEGLVGKMESGEMNLDEMIKAFEEGRKLVTECQKDLESIRQRIEKVTKDGSVEPLNI